MQDHRFDFVVDGTPEEVWDVMWKSTRAGIDTDTVQNIIKFRAGPDGVDGTDDDTPFQSVAQLASAGVTPQAAGQIGNYCTTRSTTFEIHVTARIGDQQREFVAVVFRNGPNTQIVRFYWE